MNSAVAAIQFALAQGMECATFLRLWNEGEFDVIRKEWPDAPDSLFVGADPLHSASRNNVSNLDVPPNIVAALENIAARTTPKGLAIADYAMHALADSDYPARASTTHGAAQVQWTEADAISALTFESDGSFGQDDVDSTLRLLQHIDMIRLQKTLAGTGNGTAGEPLPAGWTTRTLAIRMNGQPNVTNDMKSGLMGNFSFTREASCQKCLAEGQKEDCDNCHGESVVHEEIVVPWDLCKTIFKQMVLAAPTYAYGNPLKDSAP